MLPPGRKARVAPPLGLALNVFKPLFEEMADDPDASKTSPEKYRQRAALIRRHVETLNNTEVRRQLLDIAERYEELADGIERPRRGG